MQYPRKSHYLRFRKKDRYRSYILDYRSGYIWEADRRQVSFLRSLDGISDPYENMQGLTAEEVEDVLEFFEEEGFLDDGVRFRVEGPGNIIWTMMIPEESRRTRSLAGYWNRALMMLWFPLFLCGLSVLVGGDYPCAEIDWGIFTGWMTGLVWGVSLHELSRACACLSYGGDWVEAGFMLLWYIPSAYVLIDSSHVKRRFCRIRIAAAGPEANLALGGFFLILLRTGFFDSSMLLVAAIYNIITGIINLSLLEGLDGIEIFSELMGVKELPCRAAKAVRDPKVREKLKKQGINGKAVLAMLYMILVFQLILPFLLIMSTAIIIGVFAG